MCVVVSVCVRVIAFGSMCVCDGVYVIVWLSLCMNVVVVVCVCSMCVSG